MIRIPVPSPVSTFDKKTREAIALAVANVDDCGYRQAAHTAGGEAAGLTEQQTIDIRRARWRTRGS